MWILERCGLTAGGSRESKPDQRQTCLCRWVMVQRLAIEQIGYLWPLPGGIYRISMYVFCAKLLSSWSAREGSRTRVLVRLVFARVLR